MNSKITNLLETNDSEIEKINLELNDITFRSEGHDPFSGNEKQIENAQRVAYLTGQLELRLELINQLLEADS